MFRSISAPHSAARRAALAAVAMLAAAALLPAQDHRAPTLPSGCEAVQVPTGHVVSSRWFAHGFQIWTWEAANDQWRFAGPTAFLTANPVGSRFIGMHFGGPTWMSASGSLVVGQALASCSVDPTAVPWLLLGATSTRGPGIFARTTFIQRVNTTGGRAPTEAGSLDGQTVWVPYTAEYVFYRAR